ncbi:MAG: PQQ-dependent sugar dehydrogenase, partial [Planctomycetota bacterium]
FGERGLLGLAFHPRYASNGFFYVNYTQRSGGATMVVRYKASSTNPDLADPGSAKPILGPVSQPAGNHNGGNLVFGPDGFLYIGLGDGGGSGDPNCNAQTGSTFLGKMLRIDVDGGNPYAIPPSNPFLRNPGVLNEIWALGLRNPWRYSFDRVTGDLYIGDVGQNAREEIDFQPKASKGGENYGWKVMEGRLCFSTFRCPVGTPVCNSTSLVMPIHDYGRTTGRSVTGGFVYRGCAIPDLRGTYFFGDYVTNRIWSFRYDGKSITNFKDRTLELAPGLGLGIASISSFGEDARGELYIADHRGGEVFKIVPKAPPPAIDLGFGKPGTNGLTPRFDACGQLGSGNSALFRLFRAPPAVLTVLVLSTKSNPTKVFLGTIVPFPPEVVFHFLTNPAGRVEFTIPGGGGPLDIYGQYLLFDKGATLGISFSNALKISFQK